MWSLGGPSLVSCIYWLIILFHILNLLRMSEVVKEHAHRYFICDTFLMKWYHPLSRQLTCIQPRVCAVLKLRNKIVHSNLLLWVCGQLWFLFAIGNAYPPDYAKYKYAEKLFTWVFINDMFYDNWIFSII